MNPQRIRLVSILLMCFRGFGLVGALLALHLSPAQFVAVVAALWALAGALAW